MNQALFETLGQSLESRPQHGHDLPQLLDEDLNIEHGQTISKDPSNGSILCKSTTTESKTTDYLMIGRHARNTRPHNVSLGPQRPSKFVRQPPHQQRNIADLSASLSTDQPNPYLSKFIDRNTALCLQKNGAPALSSEEVKPLPKLRDASLGQQRQLIAKMLQRDRPLMKRSS